MKEIFLRLVAVELLLSLCLSLTGCGRAPLPASASAVLLGMCEEIPSGASDVHSYALYTRDAASESRHPDAGALTETLFSALYGEAARGLLSTSTDAPPAINDAAICLSVSPTPIELAVFRCSDTRGTATAAGLCRSRLDTLRRAWEGTEWEDVTREGFVSVEGSYVLLIVTPRPDRALRAARACIRRGTENA